MRKILLICAMGLGLAGCDPATFFNQAKSVFTASTASIANPVTPTMLYQAENGAVILFAGLNAYKRTCVNGTIAPVCKSNIRQIQVYTRRLKPMLVSLRAFVKNNDQVNAVVAYNTILGLISDAKGTAVASGVNIGGN